MDNENRRNQDIKRIIRDILQSHLEIDFDQIKNNDSLQDSGYEIDSIDLIEILVEIEMTFDFDFDDEQLSFETVTSIDRLTEVVMNHINQ